jgi:hypothetical protein
VPVIVHVAGRVVDGRGNPVAGATVTRWDSPSETTISDARGLFDMALAMTERDRSFWVTVGKAGYDTSELSRSIEAAAATSLRLHQIERIAAGESWRAVIKTDDSACGDHWGYTCRRVHVRPASSGTLTLEVTSEGPSSLRIYTGLPLQVGGRLSIPVTAGTDIAVDVAASWPVEEPAPFTLNTSLTPR